MTLAKWLTDQPGLGGRLRPPHELGDRARGAGPHVLAREASSHRLYTAVTLYDLIPELFPGWYLQDPGLRRALALLP